MGRYHPVTGEWQGDEFLLKRGNDDLKTSLQSGSGHVVRTIRDDHEPIVRFKSQYDDHDVPEREYDEEAREWRLRNATSNEQSPYWLPLSEVAPYVVRSSSGSLTLDEEAFRARFALAHEFEPGALTHMHSIDPGDSKRPFQVIESWCTKQGSLPGSGTQYQLDREPDPRTVRTMLVDSDEFRDYMRQHKMQSGRNQQREKIWAKVANFEAGHFKTTRERNPH